MKRLQRINIPDGQDPMDVLHEQRTFTGRMTAKRMECLQAIAAGHTWERYCGHEYDCCGCACKQKASVTYAAGQVAFTITTYFNH